MKEYEEKDHSIEKWSINDDLSQSFLLTVGALFYGKNILLEIACIAIALFQLWYIWFNVIKSRARIVDFHKHNFTNLYSSTGEIIQNTNHSDPLTLDIYLKNKDVRKKVNLHFFGSKHNISLTRIKLDIILPVSFTTLWILMLFTCFQ